jgi:hypothetical protein
MNLHAWFGAAAIAAGVFAVCRQVWLGHQAGQSRYWPWATGKVVRSDVASDVLRRAGRGIVYAARIEYEYVVGSKTLRGSTIALGGTFDTSARSRAEARCAKYPAGSAVNVYYDPRDPTRACLEQTAEGGPFVYALGAAAVVIGLGLLSLGRVRAATPDVYEIRFDAAGNPVRVPVSP